MASNTTDVLYKANKNPNDAPDDGLPPVDFAVGMYNLSSQGSGLEEFEGDVDELAFYNNYVLTPDQILARSNQKAISGPVH